MKTYRDDKKVAPLVRQLSWTHNLMILGRCHRPEERVFYLRLAIQERWSSRELERQLRGALFERVIRSPPKVSAPLTQIQPTAETVFKDAYPKGIMSHSPGLPRIAATLGKRRRSVFYPNGVAS